MLPLIILSLDMMNNSAYFISAAAAAAYDANFKPQKTKRLAAQLAVFKPTHLTFVLNHHILNIMQLLSWCHVIFGLDLTIEARLRETVWMTKLDPSSLALRQRIHHLVFPPVDHPLVVNFHTSRMLIFIIYQHMTTYLLICMTLTPSSWNLSHPKILDIIHLLLSRFIHALVTRKIKHVLLTH